MFAQEEQPHENLVLDVVLFLWDKVRSVMQRDQVRNLENSHYLKRVADYDKVCI